MDEDKIRKDGISPLMEVLKEVMDMFPVKNSVFGHNASSNAHDRGDLAGTIVYLAKLGVSAFISTGAGADDKDPDTVVVQVCYRIPHISDDYDPGSLGITTRKHWSASEGLL